VPKHSACPSIVILCAPRPHCQVLFLLFSCAPPPKVLSSRPMALPEAVREFFVKEGRKGGKLSAQKLTPKQRKESARRAARARWAKGKKKKTT